jgi:transcriptional regulator of acetoin/glycerol metabolism
MRTMRRLSRRTSSIYCASFLLFKAATCANCDGSISSRFTTRLLHEHPWPGNVRELDHAIERGVLLATGSLVRAADLGLRPAAAGSTAKLEEMSLDDVEHHLIQRTLSRYDGNVSQAAKALGLSRSAMYRRLQKHGLE